MKYRKRDVKKYQRKNTVMGGTKKRAGLFVIDINGNTCCIIRSLPYDKVASKLKNKIHSSINENKYVNNISESSNLLNKYNTTNNIDIITNNNFDITTDGENRPNGNTNSIKEEEEGNDDVKNQNVNKTTPVCNIQNVTGDLNISNRNSNSLYYDDERKSLNDSINCDLNDKHLDFSKKNLNASKVVINDRIILFDLKNDCFLNRINNGNSKHNNIDNYFNNYIFLEMFQIPRGSKEKYDVDLLYTAVREFYEETLCVNNSFEIYKEPFKLYWEDGGKRWTYHIFIAFLKHEPLCFSFQPKHIRNLNMYFFENNDVDNNKNNNSYKSPSLNTSEIYHLSHLNDEKINSSYNIYTTKLSKSSTGSLNSIVLIN